MEPFSVDNKATFNCLKRKFYSPELCNKFYYLDGTTGTSKTPASTSIDYKWCKCNSDNSINYP
jgi:hypothetical protein